MGWYFYYVVCNKERLVRLELGREIFAIKNLKHV